MKRLTNFYRFVTKKKIFSILVTKKLHFHPTFLPLRRTIENSLRDAVHRLYQGVLYFRNVIRFCGTSVNVISPSSLREARLSLR